MLKCINVFHIQHLQSKAQKSKQDFGKKHPARLSRKLKASKPVRKKKMALKQIEQSAASLISINLDLGKDYLQK